jgi:hypothetical protein
VDRRSKSANTVVKAARDFKNGLYRDLNFYVATEWITARGDVRPMPPSIDTHIHGLSLEKQGLINYFWSRLHPLTIERSSCEDVEWEYKFKTIIELREERKIERELLKNISPEDWDWNKCMEDPLSGGYTLSQIRNYSISQGIKEEMRKDTRSTQCALLRWKLLGEYSPELMWLRWDDLMSVSREIGMDPSGFEEGLRNIATYQKLSIEDAKVYALENKPYQLEDLKRKLKAKLESMANKHVDWLSWNWDACGLAPKKGGYTAQMIIDYGLMHKIDMEKVVGKYNLNKRPILCGVLKWLLLKEIDPAVLKVVGIGTSESIPRNDLLKMARMLDVSMVGVNLPLDYTSAQKLKTRIHKSLKF